MQRSQQGTFCFSVDVPKIRKEIENPTDQIQAELEQKALIYYYPLIERRTSPICNKVFVRENIAHSHDI